MRARLLPLVVVLLTATASIAEDSAAFTNVTTLLAGLKRPGGVAVDGKTGALFVSDTKNHQIVLLSPAGAISLLAGSGKPGLADGAGVRAEFHEPSGLAFDAVRRVLYVADRHNYVIRRITLDGVVTRVAGTGKRGFRDGSALAAEFDEPTALAVDASGALYVADTKNSAIRRIGTDGTVTTIAGNGARGSADGAVAIAQFAEPEGIAVTLDGRIYVADTGNHRIRRITSGTVTTVAGGVDGFLNGAAPTAQFSAPRGVSIDDSGNLFIADSGNGVVRKLSFADSTVTTVAGVPRRNQKPPLVDGPVNAATFDEPSAVAFAGALFVADSGHDAIRMIAPVVRLLTVAPSKGPVAGGTELSLKGSGFAPGTVSVTVGGTAATNVTYVSSTEIRATTPAHGSGSVGISITTPFGSASLVNAYLYLARPTILSIDPAKGPVAGAQSTTVRGAEFIEGETQFLFGTRPAATVVIETPGLATVTTPAAAEGVVDVGVKTAGGENTLAAGFTYFGIPSIGSVSPALGFAGTMVSIRGEHFDVDRFGNEVRFAGVPAVVTAATPTEIVTAVPQTAGSGPVTVKTAGGQAVSGSNFVVLEFTNIEIEPSTMTIDAGQTAELHAFGVRPNGSKSDITTRVTWSSANAAVATVAASGVTTAVSEGTTTIQAVLASQTATATVTVRSAAHFPPDPSTLAPPLAATRTTSVYEATAFLYQGSNAIQTGVAPGTIEPRRAALIRGSVLSASGGRARSGHARTQRHGSAARAPRRTDAASRHPADGPNPA